MTFCGTTVSRFWYQYPLLTLTPAQLRVFELQGDLISTYEKDPACDPSIVLKPPSVDMPLLSWRVQSILRRNPIYDKSGGVKRVSSFPIRWCISGLEWYPFLPATASFQYPIFAGMELNPPIVHDVEGYRLEPLVIAHWSSVELVISGTIQSLRLHLNTDPNHKPPSYPSQHGYGQSHRSKEGVLEAIRGSLSSFQQIIAYCSYSIAVSGPSIQNAWKSYYQQPTLATSIMNDPIDEGEGHLSHNLHKLLWATLGEIRQARDFVGAALHYNYAFDYTLLEHMANYGLPIYVSWSRNLTVDSYIPYPLSDLLSQWLPPVESFPPIAEDLQEGQAPVHKRTLCSGGLSIGSERSISHLVTMWKDPRVFLYKRYGLSDFSTPCDRGLPRIRPHVLGYNADVAHASAFDLHKSVIDNVRPSPIELRLKFITDFLDISVVDGRYLLSLHNKRTRSWKVLVEDPLTVLQMERERWDRSPEDFILNLVKAGLPFQLLQGCVSEGPAATKDLGLHFLHRSPNLEGYQDYRSGLPGFFKRNPHAYAAALCAGGILWRIAMDAHPFPTEKDIVRSFHHTACISRTVNDHKFWTPQLTTLEEQAIIGTCKVSECECSQIGVFYLADLAPQLPQISPVTTAGGQVPNCGASLV